MKINKIASLCKSTYTIQVYQYNGLQFIGNGSAFYPVYGMTELDEESLFVIFDIQGKKADEFNCNILPAPEGYFSNNADFENIVEKSEIRITYKGNSMMPLETSQGIVFIDTSLLAPIADKLDMVELYERTSSGHKPYIVAKIGFILQAVIMPFNCLTEAFCEELEGLSQKCMATFAMNFPKSAAWLNKEDNQLLLDDRNMDTEI